MHNPVPLPCLPRLLRCPPSRPDPCRRPSPAAVSHCNSGTYTKEPESSISIFVRVTHRAKKTLKMRHKSSVDRRNQLKKKDLTTPSIKIRHAEPDAPPRWPA